MIGLLTSNTLTLLNQPFHQMAFEFLKSAIHSITPASIAKDLLSGSPSETISRNKAIIGNVGKRIQKRTIKNALKNIADVPLEAVPFIGTVAIVTLTVSDIHDDCQTLKDLNEINIAFELETQDEQEVCGFDVSSLNKWKLNKPRFPW